MTPPLRVLSVTFEIFPLAKTGGLAGVTGALPAAQGVEVRSLVPGYPGVLAALQKAAVVHSMPDLFGRRARVLEGTAAGLRLFCIEAPHLYDRPGTPYGRSDGMDFPDNPQRFARLWRQPKGWARMQRNAMRGDYGWARPAAEYAALYRALRPH